MYGREEESFNEKVADHFIHEQLFPSTIPEPCLDSDLVLNGTELKETEAGRGRIIRRR